MTEDKSRFVAEPDHFNFEDDNEQPCEGGTCPVQPRGQVPRTQFIRGGKTTAQALQSLIDEK